jgi:CBS domain-containing protein
MSTHVAESGTETFMRIHEIMTEPVETVPASMPLDQVAGLMRTLLANERASLHHRVPHEKQHRGRSW